MLRATTKCGNVKMKYSAPQKNIQLYKEMSKCTKKYPNVQRNIQLYNEMFGYQIESSNGKWNIKL